MESQRLVLSRKYDRAIHETLGAQIIVACLAALVLDGGVMARVVGVAMQLESSTATKVPLKISGCQLRIP